MWANIPPIYCRLHMYLSIVFFLIIKNYVLLSNIFRNYSTRFRRIGQWQIITKQMKWKKKCVTVLLMLWQLYEVISHFQTGITRRVQLVVQEFLTLQEHFSGL